MNKIFFLLIFNVLLSDIQEPTYYRDFNFKTMEGINPIKAGKIDAAIAVVRKSKHSITLIGFTSLFSSNGKLDEYSETFIKKNAYYYMRDVEYDDKDFGLITQYYIINGEILINRQFKKNKKPSHTVVLRMKPTTNEVEELFFENVNIDINPKKLNRLYSNTNLTRIINNTIKISNNKLLIEQTTKKISENTSKTLNVYFTGYPDLQINSYWNIYKLFMGKDI